MRIKISHRASWRVIGVWRYFTHLVNRVDYRHALPVFHITSTYLGGGRCVAQNMEPMAKAERLRPRNGAVVNVAMNGMTPRAAIRIEIECDPESRMPDVATGTTETSVPSLVPTAIERQPCFVRYWNKWPDANIETPTTVSAGILVFIIPFIGLALILVWLLVGFSLA